METKQNIELTPKQKGVLVSLAEETGQSASSLIDQLLDEFQERLRAAPANGHSHETAESAQSTETPRQPIWAKIRDAFDHVPQEEMDELPTDGAANVDHYAYGLPKRS